MHVRLAFSVTIQVDADILLIDEVLAVGDAAFQQKCFDEFNRMRDEGRTILLVTHDMGAVSRFCHRATAARARRGRRDRRRRDDVAQRYLELNFGRERAPTDAAEDAPRAPATDGAARSPTRGSRTRTASAPTTLRAGRARYAFRTRRRVPRATSSDPSFT